MNGTLSISGELVTKLIPCQKVGLGWKLRNNLRWSFIWGWLTTWLAKGFSKLTGVVTITSELAIKLHKASGEWIDYGVVSRRVVTDAFVNYVVDDWDGGAAIIDNFNYHACGIGVGAELAANTGMGTEVDTELNPNSIRATGVKTQPAANQMRTIGVPLFDGAAAVTEHGVMSQAATGGGTLMDRSLFAAINVVSGDSIQFTYTMTLTSGG
jgi:hypothetical protein